MIRIGYLLVLFFVLIQGCTSKSKAPRILSQEEMGKVTWDLMLTDDYLTNTFRDTLKDINKERLNLYLKVFKLHKVTRDDYSASLKYYSSKPDKMKIIFDTLATRGRRLHSH